MGEVYRADDLRLGESVALKFLPSKLAQDPEALRQLQDEVRIARQVTHVNVCRVYDIGELGGEPFISMEFIDGEDLDSMLRRIGRFPGDKATEMARQPCSGLAAAHEKGVLHRDLKPANIMLDGRGKVRITDFGIAAIAGGIGDEPGVIRGTPARAPCPHRGDLRQLPVQRCTHEPRQLRLVRAGGDHPDVRSSRTEYLLPQDVATARRHGD